MRRKNKRRRSPVARLLRVMTWFFRNTLFVSGLWILYSRLVINHTAAPDPAVDAERKEMDTQAAGRLSYYYTPGKGRPLVLLHSINAAASSYEMKPLFEHYRGKRPVYALDLPGYGFSEHSPRVHGWSVLNSHRRIPGDPGGKRSRCCCAFTGRRIRRTSGA